MAFFRWLGNLIFGPPKRDVSRLEEDDLDLTQEEIDLSGGPLKPGHRRRALRDRRLLPKRKASGLSPFQRKRLLSRDEADRLFSRSGRTRNRRLRDLTTDPEQLSRHDLPLWNSESEIAEALGISVKTLQHYAIHRYRDRVRHYITFAVPKRRGGRRLIMAPKRRLKALQRQLLDLVLNRLTPPPHAHGFVKGRSVAGGASQHVGKALVVRMDLKDFFGSVTFGRVRGYFLALGYGYPVATTLALLTTEAPRQPVTVDDVTYQVPVGERYCVQGAPTSPALCNQIAARMDSRLAGLARKLGFDYTRYADDLTFSGNDKSALKHLLGLARKIVEDEGFALNRDKTAVFHRGSSQKVTGVTVNQVAGLSRRERRRLRAQLHKLSQQESPDPAELRRVRGKLAYLRMLNAQQAEALLARHPEFKAWFR